MTIASEALTAFYPLATSAGVALCGLAVAKLEKMLHIQVSAQSNAAVQAAIGNFAGKIASDVAAGKISMADVRSGAALPKLVTYLGETVADSLGHHAPADSTLQTMLVGKVAAIVTPALPAVAQDAAPSDARQTGGETLIEAAEHR